MSSVVPGAELGTAVPESSEAYPELKVVASRLFGLHDEAARGDFGAPLFFLAAKEMEILGSTELIDPDVITDPWQRIVLERLFYSEQRDEAAAVSAETRKAKVEKLRAEAREYVATLQPATATEAEKQKRWLADVDTFGTMDLVNFQLYREFSQPTLGATESPKGASYDEMVAYSDAMGSLEFRFGTGLLQEGYYDGSGLTELRLTPRPPLELPMREAKIRVRLREIVEELGVYATGAISEHLNMSAYLEEDVDGKRTARPAIGLDEERLERTLDVVSGIGAAIMDGAFLSAKYVKYLPHYSGRRFQLSTHRTLLRVKDDLMELRGGEAFQATTLHSLLWMMAGMAYGLQQRREGLARLGYPTAEVVDILLAEEGPAYDKHRDISLRRAIEDSSLDTQTRLLTLGESFIDNSSEDFADTYGFGAPDKHDAKASTALFLTCLSVGAAGKLNFERALFEQLAPAFERKYGASLSAIRQPAVLDALEAYIKQDPIRVRTAKAVGMTVCFPTLDPSERLERWLRSPVMQIAYGSHAEAYARHLASFIE